MARRYARRAAGVARRSYRRSRISGSRTNSLLAGAIAGAATPFAAQYLGAWGPAAALGATGFVMKNPTLTTLAAYSAGSAVMGGRFGTSQSQGGWL